MKAALLLLALTIISCGNSDHDDRAAAYTAAQGLVREQLKVPSSARFPELKDDGKVTADSLFTIYKTDSVTITVARRMGVVEGRYEGQNAFGVFLPGKFRVMLLKDSATGEWKGATGLASADVELSD